LSATVVPTGTPDQTFHFALTPGRGRGAVQACEAEALWIRGAGESIMRSNFRVCLRALAVVGVIGLLSACNGADTVTDLADGPAASSPTTEPVPTPPAEPAPTPAPAPAPAPPPEDPAPPPAPPPPSPTANLLFHSGFEGGALSILPALDCWGTGCWQDLVGLDALTSFTWPGNVWGGGGKFLMLTDPVHITPLTVGDYLFNRMEWVPGRGGSDTTALRQQISRNVNGTGPMGTSSSQNELVFMPQQESGDMYVSFWMKLQPDLLEKMTNLPDGAGISGGGTWRALFEFKTGTRDTSGGALDNGDYRLAAYVMTYGGGQPYWAILGDNNAGGGAPGTNRWQVENRNIAVPIGDWFKFEVFWHRSSSSDGRVWMAVNGQILADRHGPNTGAWNMPINRIMAPVLYAGSAMPIYQWVDDLEIWDGFPPAGNNPPYAAH
jgi:hypothetical protein